MSNETMPEELYASTELDCSDLVLAHRQHEDGAVHYIRADKYAELRRQNAALKELFDRIRPDFEVAPWVYEEIKKMLTDAAAMPALSKAQVVREFWDAVEKRAKELRNHPDYNGCDEDAWQASYDEARALILKEWEDETR